jgi:hypothetical protein
VAASDPSSCILLFRREIAVGSNHVNEAKSPGDMQFQCRQEQAEEKILGWLLKKKSSN